MKVGMLARRMLVLGAILAVLGLALPIAAQGRIEGEVRDRDGKPFPGVIVTLKHEEMGLTFEAKTDGRGWYMQAGLRAGTYTVQFKFNDQVFFEQRVRLMTNGEEKVNVNVKEMIEQQGAAAAAERKKQEEEAKKFESLKSHFDRGNAALTHARQLESEMRRAPLDQRGQLRDQLVGVQQTAVTEFEAAMQALTEKDENRPLVVFKLGEAYDLAGRYEEAVAQYQKAIEMKPTEAGYFNNLGNTLAKVGKIPEAMAAYERSAQLDPINAGMAYHNAGIVLYQANKLKEAVEPLKKATEINPKNAEAWYLLGSCLLASMESKKVGDKYETVVPPGTAEAYQTYLDLAPNGRFAEEAKASLVALESLGAGIPTKIRGKKKN